MTYANSKGHHNIDWKYFLDHPPQTADGWKLAEKAAYNFERDPGSCLSVELERGYGGILIDPPLRELVKDFYKNIKFQNIGSAKRILRQINERATQLLETKKQTA